MKKIYTTMMTLLLGAVASSPLMAEQIQVTFADNKFPEKMGTINNSTSSFANGHLNVEMAVQTNDKYRGDIWYNQSNDENYRLTVNAAEQQVFAIKMIGKKPQGTLKLEYLWQGATKNWEPNGEIATSSGNMIYYWNLSSLGDAYTGEITLNRYHFTIADCAEEPYNYSVDWIATFESLDTLKGNKDWKDDGENDIDEEGDVEYAYINETSGQGYFSFDEMYNAAENNHTLILKDHVTFTDRKTTKNITIKGSTGSEKIIQNFNNKLLFACSSPLKLENLIVTAQNGPGSNSMFEISKNNPLSFTDVVINGVKSSSENGIINIKADAVLNLNGVEFIDCETSALNGLFKVDATKTINLSGKNEGVVVYVEAAGRINVTGELSNEEPIMLNLSEVLTAAPVARSVSENDVIVNGATDPSKFAVSNEGYTLVAKDGNLVLAKADDTTAIETIESDDVNAPVEYFNIQGVRVENPENGLYIKRQGSKVTKVIL